MQTKKNKALQIPYSKIFLVTLAFMMVILNSFVVVALDFDNVKTYNPQTKTAVIKNAFGLGETIAELTLETPQLNLVPIGKDIKVAEIKIDSKQFYSDFYGELEFYDLKQNNRKEIKQFTYKVRSERFEDRDIYEDVCEETENKSLSCTSKVIGTEKVLVYDWIPLGKADINQEVIVLGIFTDVQKDDYIEWIPNFYGKRIEEWAIYSADPQLVAYYKMDETSGTNVGNIHSGIYNGTGGASGWTTGGKINGGYSVTDGGLITYNSLPNITNNFKGNINFTINFWINGTSTSQQWLMWSGAGIEPLRGVHAQKLNGTSFYFALVNNNGGGVGSGTYASVSNLSDGNWHMVTWVFQQQGGSTYNHTIYIDAIDRSFGKDLTGGDSSSLGALEIGGRSGSNTFSGKIDEIGIWNRSLNSSEILELYRSNQGFTYPFTPETFLNVTLIYPLNGASNFKSSEIFNSSALTTNMNITNATLYIWYSNGSLFYKQTNSTISSSLNSTYFNVSIEPNNYLWNYQWCGFNSSNIASCYFASSNFSYSYPPFVAGEIYYVNNTFETANQRFIVNYSVINALYSNAILTYNGTNYTSTTSCSGGLCSAENNLDIPLITGTQQNLSFYWTIQIYNGTSIVSGVTSVYSHNISRINMNYCASGSSLNFSSYDEQNRTRISPYSFDGSFNYYLGTGSVYRNFNYTNTSATEVNFCINPSIQTYYTDAIIAYSAPASGTSYVTRNYFFQRHPLTFNTENVSLNLLRSASSTSFILKVTDQYASPLNRVLVEAIKCYPGTNTESTAFISRTDSNGLTVSNFEAETALYKFNITNNSQSLLYVDSCSKVVPQSTPYTLSFQVGTGYTSAFEDINSADGLSSQIFYNKTSGLAVFRYTDVSGDFSSAEIVIKRLNVSGNTNPVVCSNNLTLSAGELTCEVDNAGTYIATANVYRGNEQFSSGTTFSVKDIPSIVGLYGVYIGWFIILVCAFMFKFNEIASVWLVFVAIVAIDLIGLINFGITFITAYLGLAIILSVVLER